MKRRKRRRKAITSAEMEAEYNRCLQRERDRERKWRLTKQGAFESSLIHFDMEAEECRERQTSVSWLSDQGRGARQIRSAGDPMTDSVKARQKRIDRAKHLVARNAPECLTVFWLIIKNGSNRKESIWQLERIARAQTAKSSPSKEGLKRRSIGTR